MEPGRPDSEEDTHPASPGLIASFPAILVSPRKVGGMVLTSSTPSESAGADLSTLGTGAGITPIRLWPHRTKSPAETADPPEDTTNRIGGGVAMALPSIYSGEGHHPETPDPKKDVGSSGSPIAGMLPAQRPSSGKKVYTMGNGPHTGETVTVELHAGGGPEMSQNEKKVESRESTTRSAVRVNFPFWIREEGDRVGGTNSHTSIGMGTVQSPTNEGPVRENNDAPLRLPLPAIGPLPIFTPSIPGSPSRTDAPLRYPQPSSGPSTSMLPTMIDSRSTSPLLQWNPLPYAIIHDTSTITAGLPTSPLLAFRLPPSPVFSSGSRLRTPGNTTMGRSASASGKIADMSPSPIHHPWSGPEELPRYTSRGRSASVTFSRYGYPPPPTFRWDLDRIDPEFASPPVQNTHIPFPTLEGPSSVPGATPDVGGDMNTNERQLAHMVSRQHTDPLGIRGGGDDTRGTLTELHPAVAASGAAAPAPLPGKVNDRDGPGPLPENTGPDAMSASRPARSKKDLNAIVKGLEKRIRYLEAPRTIVEKWCQGAEEELMGSGSL